MKIFSTALLLCILAGCGFALRTFDVQSSISGYALSGDNRLPIITPLQQALRQAGVPQLPLAEADLVVELLDQRNQRRSISTEGQARAAEYEISQAVEFRILDGAGNELAPSRWIERQRVFRIDRDNIVGSSEEQSILEEEVTRDLVGQLIRAIDAVSRSLPAASGDAG